MNNILNDHFMFDNLSGLVSGQQLCEIHIFSLVRENCYFILYKILRTNEFAHDFIQSVLCLTICVRKEELCAGHSWRIYLSCVYLRL